MVTHRHFAYTKARRDGHGREEGLHHRRGQKGGDNFMTKDAQLAASIMDAVVQDRSADKIGQTRHCAAQIAVVPFHSPSAHNVNFALFYRGEKRRKILRIILTVTIESENELAARLLKTVQKCGGLALVVRQSQYPVSRFI